MSFQIAYSVCVVLRLLWVLQPQTGYIYPDEFFQSPEVMARDFFSLNTTITWEWNENLPARSPVSAFLTSGLSFMFLNMLHYLKFIHITSYSLVIFPRIFVTAISMLMFDIPVYILCKRLNLEPFAHLFILSTSYITLVFGSRPFSNVLETGIFGVLLVLLVPSNNPDKYNNKSNKINYISNIYSILAGGITSLGFFCRQTFLAFSFVPYLACFIWMFKLQRSITEVILKILHMACGFLVISIFITFVDSWYFGYLQKGSIVVTPWNLIKYNLMKAHTHGRHPYFTHFLVNFPLLFGPLAFLYFFSLLSFIRGDRSQCCDTNSKQKKHDLESMDYKYFWHSTFLVSVFVSILLLSFIAHQEPRFLMPILLPLILSCSKKLINSKHSLLILWCITNVIGSLFFGMVHQGGIIPSLIYLEENIKNTTTTSSSPICHHIVYYHTYMPPSHLLVWPNKKDINGHLLFLHDLAGSSKETFTEIQSNLKDNYCPKNQNMLYVVCPGTINIGIENTQTIVKFFPHLTMEDPPNFNQYLTQLVFGSHYMEDNLNKRNVSCTTNVQQIKMLVYNLIDQMVQIKSGLSLVLYVLKL